MRRFDGKVALVIGGGSGIGAATARRLASEGARVIVADVNAAAAEAVTVELGAGSWWESLDVSDETSWVRLGQSIEARSDRCDVLVHCAGIPCWGTIETTSVAAWREALDVNALGTFLACRFGVEAMKGRGGAIVVVASTASMRAVTGQIGYAASKAAALQVMRCTAIHCGQQGYKIRCNAVLPGLVDTPMARTLEHRLGGRAAMEEAASRIHPIGRMAQPQEIAAAIAFLASDDASFITASGYAVDGGKMEV